MGYLKNRNKWLNEIKNPLRFFALALLILETLIGCLVIVTSGNDRTFILKVGMGIIIFIIIVVSVLTFFKSKALLESNGNKKIIK